MELATDGKKAAEFFNSIIPKDLAASVNKLYEDNPGATPEELLEIAKGNSASESKPTPVSSTTYYKP